MLFNNMLMVVLLGLVPVMIFAFEKSKVRNIVIYMMLLPLFIGVIAAAELLSDMSQPGDQREYYLVMGLTIAWAVGWSVGLFAYKRGGER